MNDSFLESRLSEQDLQRRSIRGVAFSVAAQAIRFVLQFGSQILLARLLVPADFGLVAMAAPVLALAQTLGELGLAQAVIQRPALTRADLSLLFWLSILVNAGLDRADAGSRSGRRRTLWGATPRGRAGTPLLPCSC